jgi:hypothetical protein
MCAMSIWGNKENCKFFTIINDILKRNGILEQTTTGEYSSDMDYWKRYFEKAGFTNVKMWY